MSLTQSELSDFSRLLSRHIARIKEAEGVNQEVLATRCEVSAPYLSKLKGVKPSRPSQQVVMSIAKGLELSLNDQNELLRAAGYRAEDSLERAVVQQGGKATERINEAIIGEIER